MVGFCEFLSSAKHFADEIVTASALKSGQFGAKQALGLAQPHQCLVCRSTARHILADFFRDGKYVVPMGLGRGRWQATNTLC